MALPTLDPNAPDFTRRYPNLADPRLGAVATFATDEFFAPKDRMLNPEPAVFIPGKYDDHGKWMDGWETRRRRNGGYDHCIVSIATEGGSGTPVPALSIEVDDADAVHARALSLGLEIVYPLVDEPWGVRRFYVRDPFGNVVNILAHQ